MTIKNWDRFLESVELNYTSDFEVIKNLCGPFFKEMSKMKDPELLFKGKYNTSNGETISPRCMKFKRRKGRIPVDMNEDISKILDKHSEEKFGFRMRGDGVFATKWQYHASSYMDGRTKPYVFFPVGDYRYVWSYKIKDLFTDIVGDDWYPDPDDYTEEQKNTGIGFDSKMWSMKKEVQEEIKDIFDNYELGSPENSTMDDIGPEEISFDCDEYLLVSIEDKVIMEEFGLGQYYYDV